MRRAPLGVLTLALLAGCATPLPKDLPLSDSVRSAAASLAAKRKTANVTGDTDAVMHMRAVGNLGAILTYAHSQRFAEHTDRLSEDLMTVVRSPGANSPPASTRALSVCGLITLKSESAAGGATGALVFLPSGGSVTPLPVGGSLPTGTREVIHSLETSSTDICAPEIGASFSYRLSGQWERSAYGPIGALRSVKEFDETTTCTAEALAPEHQYLAAFGASLAVKCVHKSINGRPTNSVSAYFPAAGRYLLVFLAYSEGTFNRYEYKSINFRQ